jgi:hypothetical protein
MRFASGSISFTAAMPASIVLRVPPVSCMTIVRRRELTARFCSCMSPLIWLRSQPSPMISAPAMFAWRA